MTAATPPGPPSPEDLVRRHRGVLAALTEGVLVQDATGRVMEANTAAEIAFGVPAGGLLGAEDPVRRAVDEDYRTLDDEDTPVARALASGSPEAGRVIGVHPADGGSMRWLSVQTLPLGPDGPGHVDMVVTSFTDVTERRALEVELTHLALHDGLTGLANRTLLLDRMGHAIARATRRHKDPTVGVSVLFIDIDNFKQVNDTIGSRAGDEILRILSQRLRSAVREEDTVARVGGDEFVVLCDEMNRTDLARFCVRVTQVFSQPVICRVGEDWRPVPIACTAGVAMARPAEDAEHFLQRIDRMRREQSAGSDERGAGVPERSTPAAPRPGAPHRHLR